MRVLLLSVVLAGCQCLEPVDERLDAGASDAAVGDAGVRDAGVPDAGVECRRASDCPASAVLVPFCTTLAPSCLSGRCVVECGTVGRSCSPGAADCYDCAEKGTACGTCSATPTCTFEVDRVSGVCSPPFNDTATLSVVPVPSRCNGALVSDGGVVGTWLSFDRQTSVVTVGALSCLATNLSTGARRTFISCPGGCSFVAQGCD